MKIVVLMENTACSQEFACEHGLSLYIEACGKRILFDAGQTDAFVENAKRLGVDLAAVDLAILSHGHYDHGGGMLRFFAENDHAPLYVSRLAFAPHYNGTEKYIGLDPAIKSHVSRLRLTDGEVSLGDGLRLIGLDAGAKKHASYGQGLGVKREDGTIVPDGFAHEQYLEITEDGRRVLISGCSHRGVLNIVEAFRPDVLVGGFHFMKLDPDGEEIRAAGQALCAGKTTYYTGHCTGEAQLNALEKIMGERLHALHAGSVLDC